jgi:hypothetical protein
VTITKSINLTQFTIKLENIKNNENTKEFLIPISISYAFYRSITGNNQNRSRNQSPPLPSIYKPAIPIMGGRTIEDLTKL